MPLTQTASLSQQGKERLIKGEGTPLFLADWLQAVFIHYEIEPEKLQGYVPFELDTWEGKAYVSLVAFYIQDMRFYKGGSLTRWMTALIASHEFLNVRTYVKQEGESGIYFITEWLPNHFSILLGPRSFGLPYRHGKITYKNIEEKGKLKGNISKKKLGSFSYTGKFSEKKELSEVKPASLDEFLLERYSAFTQKGNTRRVFRVWHPPWQQIKADIEIKDDSLLHNTEGWYKDATYIGANYAPGHKDIWMGKPILIEN